MTEHAEDQRTAAEPIALTMGEPAGIGGEITLRAWLRSKQTNQPFFVVDAPDRLGRLAEKFSLNVPIKSIQRPREASSCFPTALPVLPVNAAVSERLGQPDPANAPAILASIKTAVDIVMAGDASAVTTNPVHKEALYRTGFEFPGHTELLAHLAGIETPPVMMLACRALRVVPVTVHQSLKSAISALRRQDIVEKSQIAHTALRNDFGIPHPRLAVAGLNPHAGEGGALGDEEVKIIAPAIETLRDRGLEVSGPLPPDTLFSERARQSYDAAICMYHDQALIPIKTLDFDGAVNITLGLPFVRTSPDHGTALDIADRGQAAPDSLLAALEMAAFMASNRARKKSVSSRARNGFVSA